ncbi:MAG: hypothetical protein JNM94_16555 [Phycisphaerae bacterium]|nr:hypothetical protein [Phycisphaerae bacterium]
MNETTTTPATDADVTQALRDAAVAPKKVSADGTTVEGHDLDKLMAADRHLKSTAAASSPSRGLRFAKIIPPGAT